MPIIQASPTGGVTGSGWTAVGAGSLLAAIQETDNDGVYARSADLSGNSFTTDLTVDYTLDSAIPAGSKIVGVRRRMRAQAEGITIEESLNSRNRLGVGGAPWIQDTVFFGITANTTTSPWRTTRPLGGEWTLADVANLRTQIAAAFPAPGTPGGPGARFRYLWPRLDIDYNERPVAEYTGPTGIITDTSQPTVTWDYSDPESDPQQAFHIIVHKDNSVGVLIHDSGWIASVATEYQLPTLDNDETYWVRVEVRQVWNGSGNHGSDPDNPNAEGTFSLDLDAPAAPILVAVAEPNDARVRLELDDSGTTEPAAEWYTVQYRDDVADSWLTIRKGLKVEPPNPAIIYDYEAPFNNPREYRARALIDAGGLAIASEWFLTQETLEMPYGSTWITDVEEPDNINLSVHKNPDRVRTWQGVEIVHRPANMDLAIVEADITTPQDTISFFSTNKQEHDNLIRVFRSTRILLYRDDRREHFYFRWVGDRTRAQIGDRRIDADLFSGTQVLVLRPFS